MSDATAPLPPMSEMFPDLVAAPTLAEAAFANVPTPAAAPAPAPTTNPAAARGKRTRYELPEGVAIETVRPTHRVHRLLAEDPTMPVQARRMMDTIAANCIVSLALPAGYQSGDAEDEPAQSFVFDPKDIRAAHYNRFDDLSLVDQQAFSVAFEDQNSPTKTMVENILKPINEAKAAKK